MCGDQAQPDQDRTDDERDCGPDDDAGNPHVGARDGGDADGKAEGDVDHQESGQPGEGAVVRVIELGNRLISIPGGSGRRHGHPGAGPLSSGVSAGGPASVPATRYRWPGGRGGPATGLRRARWAVRAGWRHSRQAEPPQRSQRRGLGQGAVRPVRIVEVLVLAQHDHQMPLIPEQGPVQELTAAAADPAFHDRVHSWRLNSGPDDSDASGLEDLVERGGEAGVPVMQNELHPGARVLQVHQEVPGLLDHPRLDGVLGGAEDPDPAGAVLDHASTWTLVPLSRSVKKSSARIPGPGIAGTRPSLGRPGAERGRSRHP